jgi:hypothetical protein
MSPGNDRAPPTDATQKPRLMMKWVHLELDLNTFDENRFLPYLHRSEQAGVNFTTIADLGDTTQCRRALYELNKTCSADIPGRGEFYTFEQYVDQRIEVPTYDSRGVILATYNDSWIGMAATSIHNDYGISDMTGVVTSWRGRGLSVAMKILAIRFVRSQGSPIARLPSAHRHAETPGRSGL